MPQGIAGDQSPPGERMGPTFREVHTLVTLLMRVGTRAAGLQTDAAWLLCMSAVDERARSRKRTDDTLPGIEIEDLVLAAWELIEEAADNALPDEEAMIALGLHKKYRGKTLKARSQGAAEARRFTSGKNWYDTRMKDVINDVSYELYRLISFSGSEKGRQDL
jgi:hypothetical protein